MVVTQRDAAPLTGTDGFSGPRLGDRAFLLGATSALPVQDHGPLRIMQAWAPPTKENQHKGEQGLG